MRTADPPAEETVHYKYLKNFEENIVVQVDSTYFEVCS